MIARKRTSLSSVLAGSGVVLAAFALSGCGMISDWLEKKADKALQEELKKDSEKNAKSDGDKGDKKADEGSGPMWTETVTGSKVKMARVDLAAGGLTGMSMLAPDGAKVVKSLGGNGADVSEFGYGFSVWVTEDPTATMDLMKKGAEALHKDGKLENVDDNSFIVAAKGFDGAPAYYYKGLFKANGKTYRCETQTSTAPGEKSHAEQIDKACESLQIDGKSMASNAAAAPAEKETAAADADAAKDTKPASETKPASDSKPASNGSPAPAKEKEKTAEAPKDAKPASTGTPASAPAAPPPEKGKSTPAKEPPKVAGKKRG